jgi:hypothetical protein
LTKFMLGLVMSLVLITSLGGANEAAAGPRRKCIGWEYQIKHKHSMTVRQNRARRLIRCVFAEVGIPGEATTAYIIANRESGYAPWAHNQATDCRGMFQHMGRYWATRARGLPRAQFPRWPNMSAFNARANVWVSAQMVRAGGWSPWSTYGG